ncbi:large conductance mechanosensitive channel protein MscL [bacterium 1XD8-76]|nr:large conductance mechanosensitive channel protein MscL [bacterium 1XD8-76]
MKKFLEEFKAFALKGNVMNMAVGVIIGAAFGDLVTSFTTNIIQPIIACIGSAEVHGRIDLFGTGNYIDYGAFLSSVIYFLIMALVIFMLVKTMNRVMDIGKKKEEAPAPTTKKCPYCRSEIALDAVRCPHCTSEL